MIITPNIDSIQKEIDPLLKRLHQDLFYVKFMGIWSLSWVYLLFSFPNITNISTFVFIGLPLVYLLATIYYQLSIKVLTYFRWKRVHELNKALYSQYQNIAPIDDIIKNTEIIKTTITQISKSKFRKGGEGDTILQINLFPAKDKYILKEESQFLYNILTDLRSDLQIRLTEQQQILESAKSEVTENIQWTTELAQVSELQKIRLDKQIEQFEELQRVLVKV